MRRDVILEIAASVFVGSKTFEQQRCGVAGIGLRYRLVIGNRATCGTVREALRLCSHFAVSVSILLCHNDDSRRNGLEFGVVRKKKFIKEVHDDAMQGPSKAKQDLQLIRFGMTFSMHETEGLIRTGLQILVPYGN